jgi:hypothetical protein
MVTVGAGQSIHGGRLFWFTEYHCPLCGAHIVEDGRDETPEYIRLALLDGEGHWSLVLSDSGPFNMKALKILRDTLHLGLMDLQELLKRLPGRIADGTKTEMELLSQSLTSAGLRTNITPYDL